MKIYALYGGNNRNSNNIISLHKTHSGAQKVIKDHEEERKSDPDYGWPEYWIGTLILED